MVTTIEGRPIRATNRPLTAPQARPVAMPVITNAGVPKPAVMAAPIMVEASAMIEATERSISPAMMSMAMAKAISAFSVKLKVASDRFHAFRK